MKKVVEVKIFESMEKEDYKYWYSCFNDYVISSPYFNLRSSAIRNARKFFKKLGYEVEIVK